MDFDILNEWIPFVALIISIINIYYTHQSNSDRKKQIQNMKIKDDLFVIRKVFPVEINSEYHHNIVGLYNNSSYPIYDIFILQGINTFELDNAEHYGVVKYVRSLEPKTKIELDMENAGLGMCKYFVVGIFFRDYKGNEWFRDSMGKLEKADSYKEMLHKKKAAVPPYLPSTGTISSLH